MKTIYRLLAVTLPAVFTIEASVILPIIFVIIVWFISVSFTIHDKVRTFSEVVYAVISNAPYDNPDEKSGNDLINIANLDGRNVLLGYKLLKDGLQSLSGGLDDED